MFVEGRLWELHPGDKESLLESVDRSAIWNFFAVTIGFQRTFENVRVDIEEKARGYRLADRAERFEGNPLEIAEQRSRSAHRR